MNLGTDKFRPKIKKLTLTSAVIILLTVCASAFAMTNNKNITLVYINNGAIQCKGAGMSHTATANLLKKAKVNVHSSQCARLTHVVTIAMCGSHGTNINIHSIDTKDLAIAQSLGFKNIKTLQRDNNKGYEIFKCK